MAARARVYATVVARAVAALRAGRVVAAPTETFYGLLADASDRRAVGAVFTLKGRSTRKTMGLILPDREAWTAIVGRVPPAAAVLADAFWPGPLTIAVPARRGVDRRLVWRGAVAARWPGPSLAAAIARSFGAPLTATSANAAGEPPPRRASQVRRAFRRAVADGSLVVVGRAAPGGAPSTVVAVGRGGARLLRQGAVPEDAIVAALRARPRRPR